MSGWPGRVGEDDRVGVEVEDLFLEEIEVLVQLEASVTGDEGGDEEVDAPDCPHCCLWDRSGPLPRCRGCSSVPSESGRWDLRRDGRDARGGDDLCGGFARDLPQKELNMSFAVVFRPGFLTRR